MERQPQVRPVGFVYAAGAATGAHAHDEHQLVYAGEGVLSVETDAARWILPAQRAAWVPAGIVHEVAAESDATMAALYVEAVGEPVVPDLPSHIEHAIGRLHPAVVHFPIALFLSIMLAS